MPENHTHDKKTEDSENRRRRRRRLYCLRVFFDPTFALCAVYISFVLFLAFDSPECAARPNRILVSEWVSGMEAMADMYVGGCAGTVYQYIIVAETGRAVCWCTIITTPPSLSPLSFRLRASECAQRVKYTKKRRRDETSLLQPYTWHTYNIYTYSHRTFI